MTASQLKDELKSKGLKQSGNKNEMLDRLMHPKQDGGSKLACSPMSDSHADPDEESSQTTLPGSQGTGLLHLAKLCMVSDWEWKR